MSLRPADSPTPRVYVSVTTTPARLPHIHECLQRWDRAGVSDILLHLPDAQLRTGQPYPADVPPALAPLVRVHRCGLDWGPLTKWIGPLLALGPRGGGGADDADDATVVVVADDDTIYHAPTFGPLVAALQTAERAHGGAVPCAVGGVGQPAEFWGVQRAFPRRPRAQACIAHDARTTLNQVDVVEGFGAVAVRLGTLRDPWFRTIVQAYATADLACWLSDDIVVNAAFDDMGVQRYVVAPRLPLDQLFLPAPLCAWNNRDKYCEAADHVLRVRARVQHGDRAQQ